MEKWTGILTHWTFPNELRLPKVNGQRGRAGNPGPVLARGQSFVLERHGVEGLDMQTDETFRVGFPREWSRLGTF